MEIPTNLSISLSEFEDPIHMEPLTDVIRCPHHPAHNYQIGTLPKRTQKGIEYTQCSLTNEWFVSSEFKRDGFTTKAMNKIQELNNTCLKRTEEKLTLEKEVNVLRIEVSLLTEQVKSLIDLDRAKTETNEKMNKEFKDFILAQEETHRKEMEEERKHRETLERNNLQVVITYQKNLEDQNKRIEVLTNQIINLSKPKAKDASVTYINAEKILKIAITFFTVGGIVWAYKKIYEKVVDIL
jgi:hypothetical protein